MFEIEADFSAKIVTFKLVGGMHPPIPLPKSATALDPRNSPRPLQISGYAPASNHVFALFVSMPPEFSLMPRFKSINFYQNKPKIKLVLQKKVFFGCGGVPPYP